MPEAPSSGTLPTEHPELVETELAPPGAAGDAIAVATRTAQQVLDTIAQAVSTEGPAASSALAPIEGARSEVAFPEAGAVVRQRSEHRRSGRGRSGQRGSPEPDEEAVLDDLASAREALALAARSVREGFLRLADIEIRRTLGIAAGVPPAPRRDERDARPVATSGPAAGPEAGNAAVPEPRAYAPGELYEGTVRLLVMADGNVQRIVQFVDELCQMPQFRMLRMTGSRQQDGAEISLGLREPLPFAKIVGSMPNVVRVDVPSPDDAAADSGIGLTVYLAPAAGDDLDLTLIEPPIEPEA